MKTNDHVSREEFAARLEKLAATIRESGRVQVGAARVAIPEAIDLEMEIEADGGTVEFEIEATWARRSANAKRLPRAPIVGILTGSPTDLPTVSKAAEVLAALGVPAEVRALSAHRTPEETLAYVRTAESRGIEVIIACAGLSAHLAGVVAAHTHLPVIGVPLASGVLNGLDSLLSTVQMPPGVPVATVGIDGVRNAAVLAARILALRYPALRAALDAAAAADRARYFESNSRAKARRRR